MFALSAVGTTPEESPRARPRYVAAIIALVLLSAVAAWLLRRPSSADSAATPAAAAALAPRGIAVLPFENLGATDQAYFAAGVTEEVTLQIAKISALRVMSRAADARFKGGDVDPVRYDGRIVSDVGDDGRSSGVRDSDAGADPVQ